MASPGSHLAVEQTLAQLEGQLQALRARFEQYFMGMERVPPTPDRDELRKQLQSLQGEVRNTGLKFRLEALRQRFLTYDRMWQRTLKEIEEGRYKRDVAKARRRTQAAASPKADAASEGVRKDRAKARPADGGLSDERLEKLYKTYVAARRRCDEDTSKLTVDSLRRSLERQLPSIKEKHGGREVDFKVVIKGGRAVLKAVPKTRAG